MSRNSLILVAVILTAGCSGTQLQARVLRPAIVPDGWTADYDYASGMQPYLRRQVDNAIVEGATAYIYIYSDRSESCRSLRRLMSRDYETPLFRDVRVSMLDFWKLHASRKKYPGVAFDPGDWSGVFVKITSDGTFSEAMFYARMYLHSPYVLPDYGYEDPGRPTPRDFIAALRRFFADNAGYLKN